MRRLSLSFLACLLLAGFVARPAAAADLKEYTDCMKFTTTWCDLTREEADNWLEAQAIEFNCAFLYLNCTAKLV